MQARAYVEKQITDRRQLEAKLMLLASYGIPPRFPKPQPLAASRAGDVAAERMHWEALLRLLDAASS
jgi:hypothetical protein